VIPKHLVLFQILQQGKIVADLSSQAAATAHKTNQSDKWRDDNRKRLSDGFRIHSAYFNGYLRQQVPTTQP